MQQEIRNIKYFIYARKSSESDDRQVQSIDDQINRLKQLARDLQLNVKEIYTEAKSAKKPNNRPVFDEVLKRIERGEANGILCWQINRLSRNPVDSGRISWLLQQGILKSIQTIDRQYLPDDNVLLFSVESGSANQFILDLKKNVIRGMESKLQKGWAPGMAPLGYLNDRLEKIIIKDPERFNLVRKMWKLMLTGAYTPPKILDIATREWGFTTRTWNKKGYGGKPVAYSSIYKMFTNIFYAGIIDYFGKQYVGKHEPMITLDEYKRVQEILSAKGKPKPKQREFAFTGTIHCGECGCLYTAETKQKLLKKSGKVATYTYYHCTRKTRKVMCTQKKAVTGQHLEEMIVQEISKYSIKPEFLEFALKGLDLKKELEIKSQANINETLRKNLITAKNEREELVVMRRKRLIDDETFLKEHNELTKTIADLGNQLQKTEARAKKWIDLTRQTFLFAANAKKEFAQGGLELKREILTGLAKSLIIIDGKLFLTPRKWYELIQKVYSPLEKKFKRLELNKTLVNTGSNASLDSLTLSWYGLVEDVRNYFEKLDDDSINIPKLQ